MSTEAASVVGDEDEDCDRYEKCQGKGREREDNCGLCERPTGACAREMDSGAPPAANQIPERKRAQSGCRG